MFPHSGSSPGPAQPRPTRLARARDSLCPVAVKTSGELPFLDEHPPAPAPPALYDEFAIGWNEIFDQDRWVPDSPLFAAQASPSSAEPQGPPPPLPRRRRGSAAAAASGTPRSVDRAELSETAEPGEHEMPPVVRATSSASQPGASRSEASTAGTGQLAFWSTEASKKRNSKKLPEYMRITGGKQSAIERGMKERLLACPTHQVRKPAQVMESELDTLRHALTLEHSIKRREARQLRRLQRRCRVKDGEDLDELEARYPPNELRAMPDPAEKALTPRHLAPNHPSKEFFELLRSRRAPSPPPVNITVTWRVGGAASHIVPHTAR